MTSKTLSSLLSDTFSWYQPRIEEWNKSSQPEKTSTFLMLIAKVLPMLALLILSAAAFYVVGIGISSIISGTDMNILSTFVMAGKMCIGFIIGFGVAALSFFVSWVIDSYQRSKMIKSNTRTIPDSREL